MKVDLHLHTSCSDGSWSPAELVAHAVRTGMSTIAITDHDTIDGIVPAIAAAADQVDVLPGLEINTIWRDGHGKAHDIHILGYLVDLNNSVLARTLRRQVQAREDQVEELVSKLRSDGMRISMDLIRQVAGSSPIGRLHVTQAIVAVGGAEDVSTAYSTYLTRGSAYFVERLSVDPYVAIESIASARGVSSIAHPGAESAVLELIEDLSRHGLDGIEVYHSHHNADVVASHLKLAEKLGLLVTGGSDCHGPFQEHQSLMGTIAVPHEIVPPLKERARSRKQILEKERKHPIAIT